jgi:regulatory protein
MSLVTEIRVPRRGSRRREVMLDGEPWRTTSVDVVRATDLRAGAVMPAPDLSALLDAHEPRSARERAFRILGYRDRSSTELRERLVDEGYPYGLAADLVAGLQHSGIVDDDRYASTLARTLTTGRGLGRARAQRELTARGIGESEALAAVDAAMPAEDEEESARRLASALASRAGANVQRIAGRLARKGFPAALAYRVAREALGKAADMDTPPDLPVSDD